MCGLKDSVLNRWRLPTALCMIPDLSGRLQLLLLVALLFGSIGGLVVAAILKLLDNIVKVRFKE